jgi:hypothetical protein
MNDTNCYKCRVTYEEAWRRVGERQNWPQGWRRRMAAKRIPFYPAVVALGGVLLLSGYFAFRVHNYAVNVDASGDLRAERWGTQVMTDVPNDALVFVKGDRAVFGLWYFHFALEQRSDLIIVAEELLHFDWYQETLRDTYPSLDIPAPFPWPHNIIDANPTRPVCHIRLSEQLEIECK